VGTNTGTSALAGGTAIGTGEGWKRAVHKLCQFASTKEALRTVVADPKLPEQDRSCLPWGIPTQERLRECRVAHSKHIKLVNFDQSRFLQFQHH